VILLGLGLAVADCGGLWQVVAGCGRLCRVVSGCGRLVKASLILCVAYSGIASVPGTPFSFRTSHALFLQPLNAKQSSMARKVPSGTLEDGIPDKFPWDIDLEPSLLQNQENATP
jgi:hypothetical protein